MNAWLRRKFHEHGLQRVPDNMRRSCACKICDDNFPNTGPLWTPECVVEPAWAKSIYAYRTWFGRIKRNCYCTTHAESHIVDDGQQFFLSKDGKTKYLISRNFPE